MIAILADDFTGSAEMGAVALRFGLACEVQMRLCADSSAALIILNTESRLMPPAQAGQIVVAAVNELARLGIECVYKKIDSALRGPVVAEVASALMALNKGRALLVPANPSLGRLVRDGQYFINGLPLHQTSFATDPQHPAKISNVLDIIGTCENFPVSVLKKGQELPACGIAVGEVAAGGDVVAWAGKLEGSVLPVGGADFFEAVLESRGLKRIAAHGVAVDRRREPALFICGSSPDYALATAELARSRGLRILPMPEELFAQGDKPASIERWSKQICRALANEGAAMVTIGRRVSEQVASAELLGDRLAEVAVACLDRCEIANLYVEGGSTASSVVERAGWQRFALQGELAPGAAIMSIVGREKPLLTIKPGSYPWSESVWQKR